MDPLIGTSPGLNGPADPGHGDTMEQGPRVIVRGRQPRGPVHDGITIIQLNRCYRFDSIIQLISVANSTISLVD